MKKFWIIFSTTSDPRRCSKPTREAKKHYDKEKALTELNRLAKQERGREFILLESICSAVVTDVAITPHT